MKKIIIPIFALVLVALSVGIAYAAAGSAERLNTDFPAIAQTDPTEATSAAIASPVSVPAPAEYLSIEGSPAKEANTFGVKSPAEEASVTSPFIVTAFMPSFRGDAQKSL